MCQVHPVVDGLLQRLSPGDKQFLCLRQTSRLLELADRVNAVIKGPSKEQRDDEEYRRKVSNLNRADYDQEWQKIR